jgi:Spy/CpxP family protein refolding chaperone
MAVVAQQKRPQPQDTYDEQGHFEFMSKELNLTPEQRPKVKAIVDAQMQQWAVLGKNKTLDGKQKVERMREINQDAQTRIEALLTPPQKLKLREMMEKAKPPVSKSAPKKTKPARPPE